MGLVFCRFLQTAQSRTTDVMLTQGNCQLHDGTADILRPPLFPAVNTIPAPSDTCDQLLAPVGCLVLSLGNP